MQHNGHHSFFFFNDTATTEIYTLSLHDALPIYRGKASSSNAKTVSVHAVRIPREEACARSEEHTSELQSLAYLVCRLLLEKKKNILSKTHEENRSARLQAHDAPLPDEGAVPSIL